MKLTEDKIRPVVAFWLQAGVLKETLTRVMNQSGEVVEQVGYLCHENYDGDRDAFADGFNHEPESPGFGAGLEEEGSFEEDQQQAYQLTVAKDQVINHLSVNRNGMTLK